MTEPETKEARKKRLQHEAWKRWYDKKGKAYREKHGQKMKEQNAVRPEPPNMCPNCTDPACKLNGCMVSG